MIEEMIGYIERIIYENEILNDIIFRINVIKRDTDIIPMTVVNCRFDMKFVERDLTELLHWTVEAEEYELSHRIKTAIDHITKNIKSENETN